MARAVQMPAVHTDLEIFRSGSRNRKFIGLLPRTTCFLACLGVRHSTNGSLVRRVAVVSETSPKAIPAQCLAETDGAHSRSMRLIARHFRVWIDSNLCHLRRSFFSDLLIRFVANLQILGILTAVAMGVGVAPPIASASGFIFSTERTYSNSVERSCAKSSEPSDFEKVEEGSSQIDVRPDAGLSPRTTGHTRVVPESSIGDDEFEDLSAKPYAITIPLRVVGLRGSVPPAWLKDFLGSQGKRVKLTAEFQGSLRSIFSELSSALESKQLTARSVMAADLVTIGDSWLSKAVSRGLINPVENAEQCGWYHRMGSKWQTFLRRDENGNIDSNGKVWGVPYRWGSLVIAYNRDKLQQHGIPAIKDWTDLWKPELAGKISMVASPREIVGAVLKVLGASYNVNDFETDVPGGRQAMEDKFLAFQLQVRLFDDVQYLKTLGAGEVWVAVGWSEDIISFAKRSSNITVVAPQSGTSMWADLWAIPATTTMRSTKVGGRIRGPSPLVLQWLDFCLQPARAISFEHSVLAGASPLAFSDRQERSQTTEVRSRNTKLFVKESYSDNRQDAGPNLETDLPGQLTPDFIAKCEFLEPLSEKALGDFKWLLSRTAVVQRSPVGLVESLRRRVRGFLKR
ncbi:unnamed protein product [Calypogeia fissa]